jgi:hypothetical protein
MRLKLLLITVFAAGLGASYALADNGHGHEGGNAAKHGTRCQEVHVRGAIAPQTFTVTLDKASSKLNLAAGSQVVVQVGGTGQTVRLNAEACATTTGAATQLQVKEAELHARSTVTTTTATTTTAPTTTH